MNLKSDGRARREQAREQARPGSRPGPGATQCTIFCLGPAPSSNIRNKGRHSGTKMVLIPDIHTQDMSFVATSNDAISGGATGPTRGQKYADR